MAIILFDNSSRNSLFPFTYTRAVADLRFGIFTMRERWEKISGKDVFVQTEDYLQPLYAAIPEGDHCWIDASVVVTNEIAAKILSLDKETCLADETGLIAGMSNGVTAPTSSQFAHKETIDVQRVVHPWHLMQWNDAMLRFDFELLRKGTQSVSIPEGVQVLNAADIFIEEGAKLQFCTLNASAGPIYIGRDAEVMEGSVIRGPFCLGNNGVVKMNSRIYGATTLGPFCMGGGEIKNVVMMGYSNKAHDGYLGDSVVGEWCNFGAGSTNSNVKNTAGEIRVWDFAGKEYVAAGNKCGVMMGDYSRVAINSSINTGSMIGISCNVFGKGLLPTVIENFTWGDQGKHSYELEKAIDAINNWMKMKGRSITKTETSVLAHIFAASR